MCLCGGAVLAELGSLDAAAGDERRHAGELMMLMAVFAASCKSSPSPRTPPFTLTLTLTL